MSKPQPIPDKERWLALLSYGGCTLTKEDSNCIAEWIRTLSFEGSIYRKALQQIAGGSVPILVSAKSPDHPRNISRTALDAASGNQK